MEFQNFGFGFSSGRGVFHPLLRALVCLLTLVVMATVSHNVASQPAPMPLVNGVPIGQVITIRANANGKIVTAETGGADPLIANRTAVGGWEKFVVVDMGAGKVALRALANNKFVSADNFGQSPLVANRDQALGWETFTWVSLPNGNFALRADANGLYVTAENGGDTWLYAARTAIGGWESFAWTISGVTSFYYRPENITDGLADRYTYGAWPDNKTVIHIYDLGQAAETPIGWNVGAFTGFEVPSALAPTFQRGYSGTSYGSTAFQLYGTTAGFMIQSDLLPPGHPSDPGWLGGAHLAYTFPGNTIKPWATLGQDARLRLQYDVQIQHFSSSKPDCIAYFPGALVVGSANVTFQFVFFVWDSRSGSIREYIAPDLGTALMNVNTFYGAGTAYATSESNSTVSGTSVTDGQPHWYAAYITWNHMLSVINAYNAQAPAAGKPQASINPNDYWVHFITAGPEMQIPKGANSAGGLCHYGSNVHNMNLIAYTP